MHPIMRRDRSSRCVTSARDEADHHNRRKLRLRCNSSDRKLSREVAVRSNVKLNALSLNNQDRNHSNNHADNRSRLSVEPVRLRLNDPCDR